MVDLSHWPIILVSVNGWVAVIIGLFQAFLWVFVFWLWGRIRKLEDRV